MKEKKEFFEKLAQDWDKEHQAEEEVARTYQFAGKYLPLSRGERVLDIGCGTSRLVPHITRSIGDTGTVIEIDFSIEMLKIGKKRYNTRNTFFVQGDGHCLPLRDHSLDTVICMAFFPHLSDKSKALKGFASVLKPGGKIYIAHQMNRVELNRLHSNVDGPVKKDLLPDQEEMKRLLESEGFMDIETREEPGLYLAVAVLK